MVRLALGTVVFAGLLGLVPGGPTASAAGAIHPGMQLYTAEGGQCTANFVFKDTAPEVNFFIGQAAHCATPGAEEGGLPTDTDGCRAGTLPEGKVVEDENGDRVGLIVYSSWVRMQSRQEREAEACAYNDFALVKVDPAREPSVAATMPYWGGPAGLATTLDVDEDMYTYGNSSLRLGLSALSPNHGYNNGNTPGGWSHTMIADLPGLPGDSGSGVLDSEGKAVGVLVTVSSDLTNGVSNLSKLLAYAQATSGIVGLQLLMGGPFSAD